MYASAVGGSEIVTLSLRLSETLPAPSLTQAYSVLVPVLLNVWIIGFMTLQRLSAGDGVAVVSVKMYSDTPDPPGLSEASKFVIHTVSIVAVEGIENASTVGFVVSGIFAIEACSILVYVNEYNYLQT